MSLRNGIYDHPEYKSFNCYYLVVMWISYNYLENMWGDKQKSASNLHMFISWKLDRAQKQWFCPLWPKQDSKKILWGPPKLKDLILRSLLPFQLSWVYVPIFHRAQKTSILYSHYNFLHSEFFSYLT